MAFDQDLNEDDQTDFLELSAEDRRLVTQSYDLSVGTSIEQWNDNILILPEIQREYVWNNMKAIKSAPSAWEAARSPQFRAAELDIQAPASECCCL